MTDESAAALRRLPAIRRAREYHLYDERGRRYLDLWLGGGRALLGHRPGGLVGEMKNVLEKGLLGELPSIYEHRVQRALALILSGYREYRFYRSIDRLLAAVRPVTGSLSAKEIPDLALLPAGLEPKPSVAWWRPFLPQSDEGPGLPLVALPIIPFEGPAPVVAAFREAPGSDVPQSDLVSPVVLAGMAKSIHLLVRFRERYTEDVWRKFDSPVWQRRGPYLAASCPEARYGELFEHLLERGILISPSYPGPSIVPAIATDGELAPLRELARKG